MKKSFIPLLGMLLYCSSLLAQQPDYRVVFDLTSKDSAAQQSVIRFLNEISSSNPAAKLEVVMYGKGLDLVVKDKSLMPADVQRLKANQNISFKVCAVAMKNNGIDRSQLLPGVEVVPDGIFEIISKQKDGWGYIKVAR